MKKMLFYALLFAFVSVLKAQEVPMNAGNILLSQRAVTASQIPASGWFLLVSDKQVEDLKLKPIQVFSVSHNSTTDIVTLSQPNDKATAGVWQLFDSDSKLLWSQKVNERDIDTAVNIQNLLEGIYFVSFIVNGEKRFNQKFIKVKSN